MVLHHEPYTRDSGFRPGTLEKDRRFVIRSYWFNTRFIQRNTFTGALKIRGFTEGTLKCQTFISRAWWANRRCMWCRSRSRLREALHSSQKTFFYDGKLAARETLSHWDSLPRQPAFSRKNFWCCHSWSGPHSVDKSWNLQSKFSYPASMRENSDGNSD